LPELQELYAKYGSRPDFKLVVVSSEIPDTVASFFRRNDYTMPFYTNEGGSALRKFAKGGIPRSFLINKEGIVVQTLVGYSKDEKTGLSNFLIISRELERLLR
jgi:hypothetical protein